MEGKSSFLRALQHVYSLSQSCAADDSINADSEVLGNIRNTVQCLENFLKRSSRTHPEDHDSAIGTPSTIHSVNEAAEARTPELFATVQILNPNNVTPISQNLPVLVSNFEFDNHLVASNPISSNRTTPTLSCFDFDLYFSDAGPVEDAHADTVRDGAVVGDQESYDNHNGTVDDTGRALTDEIPQDDRSQNDRDVDGVGHALSAGEKLYDVNQIPDLAGRGSRQATPARFEQDNRGSSKTVDQQTQTAQNLQPPCQHPSRKRKHGEKPQGRPDTDSKKWPDLDVIQAKVASPDEIYQRLVEQVGDEGSMTPRIRYLTRLFFHFGGPSAFQEVGNALSAISRTEKSDCVSIGGRIRALDRISGAKEIEERALVVGLSGEIRERTLQHEQTYNRDAAHKRALHEMMACAYPDLDPKNDEYKVKQKRLQQSLYNSRNWVKAGERCPCALWMFPSNMSEKEFRRLPEELLFAFFDLLYKYRSGFLQRIDNLLGPQVAQFVAGQRPARPVAFDGMTMKKMKKQPMDSEYFVDLSRTLVSSMIQDP